MKRFNIKYIVIGMTLLLSACTSSTHFAPVTDGWSNMQAASQTYRVQPEDTLYSIAFRYGLDYRQLADANHIAAPYHVVAGQTLVLLPQADDTLTTSAAPAGNTAPATAVVTGGAPSSAVSSQPVNAITTSTATPPSTTPPATAATPQQTTIVKPTPAAAPTGPVGQWLWPTQGKVIHTFSAVYGGNKGIDITGSLGQPVRATAGGRVVYAGTGLRGYGLLIIIKHNNDYLSAYAHNSKAYVQEGDVVNSGQTIASMGSTDAPQNMLHFEIRKDGKPVDPLSYLPSK
jgi:lipoprotein NlpD